MRLPEHPCKCRNCGKIYNELKATGDWKGYCTQRCTIIKAKELGYRESAYKKATLVSDRMRLSIYGILRKAGEIGSVRIAERMAEQITPESRNIVATQTP